MPRGTKRSHDGDPTPTVGVKKLSSKVSRKSGEENTVAAAAMFPGDKSSPGKQRASSCTIKAKRQIDFVYDLNDNRQKNVAIHGANNNAQPLTKSKKKGQETTHVKKNMAAAKMQGDNGKRSKSIKSKTNHLFDGIQVSVGSDADEELDYEDDVLNDEDEGCSMDEDVQDDERVVESRNNSSVTKETSPVNSTMVDLGATSASLTDEELVMNNPHLRKLLNKMLDE